MPTGRMTIYTRDGEPLTDIRAGSIRSWVLSGVGQAEFGIAYNDQKCQRKFLEFGNLIKIEHDSLPDWIGMIDTPRQWRSNYLVVRAYEIGRRLRQRRTPASTKLSGTAGQIAAQLIDLANEQGDTQIRVGSIYGGGADREETLGDNVLAHVDALRKRAANEWLITPAIEDGELTGEFNWYATAGQDVSALGLTNLNTERNSYTLSEEGDIINDLRGYGDATTTNTRLTSYKSDNASIGRYGLRQGSRTYSGNRVQSTLDSNVDSDLQISKSPVTVFQATILDVGSIFKYLRLGNRLPVNIAGIGFSDGSGLGYQATVRVTGMRYSDFSNKVELITNEEIEDGG